MVMGGFGGRVGYGFCYLFERMVLWGFGWVYYLCWLWERMVWIFLGIIFNDFL